MSESVQYRAQQAYVHQGVESESPLGLVVRIYQFALVQCRRTRAAMAAKDWKTKGESMSRLLRSLTLLQNSLDVKAGGKVAENLDALYAYMIRRVGEANVEQDPTKLDEVEKYLAELGEAWKEAAERPMPQAEAVVQAVAG